MVGINKSPLAQTPPFFLKIASLQSTRIYLSLNQTNKKVQIKNNFFESEIDWPFISYSYKPKQRLFFSCFV